MSAPLPNLAELPVEVLEQILIRLPGQDIVKMEAVNRHLRDLIHNFPALHHRRELFATGLIDNPRCPCDLAQRRRLRERHAHKWSNAVSMVETPLKSPPGQSAHWLDNANYLGNGLLAVDSAEQNSITFLHIPPVASRKPVEGWSIPPFTFGISGYAAYPPENVLAVAERRENSMNVHTLNLQDGSPHPSSPPNTIKWELSPNINGMAITTSRIMMYGSYWGNDPPAYAMTWKMAVWDWKTGELVFNLSFPGQRNQVTFLDEFRIAILPDESTFTEFVVLNTLIPQDHPGNLWRLGVPQQLPSGNVKLHVDHDQPLGTLNKDEPLIADPAQTILVVEIMGRLDLVFLAVRTQALVEQACSTRAGSRVSWEEWGTDAMITRTPRCRGVPDTFVHGAQVMVMWPHEFIDMSWSHACYHEVYTLDFSQRGRSSLPLGHGEGGGSEGSPLSEGEGCIRFEPGHGMRADDKLGSLSDGSLFFLGLPGEGLLGGHYSPDLPLHVWELV